MKNEEGRHMVRRNVTVDENTLKIANFLCDKHYYNSFSHVIRELVHKEGRRKFFKKSKNK